MGEFTAISTTLPTYLQILLREKYTIQFLFRQFMLKKNVIVRNDSVIIDDETTSGSQLELTGTPLETDLGGNEVVNDDTLLLLNEPQSWTSDEANYFPVTLEEARTFINIQLSEGKASQEIFCLCDGKDEKSTVLMGCSMIGRQLSRTLVHVLPCCSEDDEILTVEFMKKDHLQSAVLQSEMELLIVTNYYLYGCNLTNSRSLQLSEKNASVAVEIIEDSSQNRKESFKINLQVITGHSQSPVFKFWQEVQLLWAFSNILGDREKTSCESTRISDNYLEYNQIISEINNLLDNIFYVKGNKTNKGLDLENLYQETVLDRVWKLLKKCETLDDLRECFNIFFMKLTETEIRVTVYEDNKSNIANIVSGIVAGEVAVPTLSFAQCLELLIELGLEKLKSDYVSIIKHFYPSVERLIMSKWLSLSGKENLSDRVSNRKTKLSINPRTALVDLTKIQNQLSFIENLHNVVEFMFLNEHLELSGDNFFDFCQNLCTNFIEKQKQLSCENVRLCEFSFQLMNLDTNNIKDKTPVSKYVKVSSKQKSSEVMTVFYFSEFPIFPSTVYDAYRNVSSCDDRSLYVTKLVKYIYRP